MIGITNTMTIAAALGTTSMLLCPPHWYLFQDTPMYEEMRRNYELLMQPAWALEMNIVLTEPTWQSDWQVFPQALASFEFGELEPFEFAAGLAEFEFAAFPPAELAAPQPAPASHVTPVDEVDIETRTIDLAICLDTSGSMSGLIESAKQKLWEIVNDLALAEPTPELRVALLTFGNDGHNPENGWVRVDIPFTEDLDAVSQQLFSLTTNGGTELVGRVLHNAAEQLDWHPSDDALKLIVVAGNESADQDQEMPFRDVCKATITRGIMINSIYCGNPADDIAPGWAEVARLADGHYASIDHDNGTVVIATPFDAELASLSTSVNETYIPFGEHGFAGCSNQLAQDANATALNSAAAASRAQTKASGLYWNTAWDLVDACAKDTVKLAEVKEEDLPENMRQMTLEERQAYVEQMSQQRVQINAQISDLNQQRQQFITQQMRQQQLDETDAFDAAVRSAIREQAASKGFQFKEIAANSTAEGQPAPVQNPGLVRQVDAPVQQGQTIGQIRQQVGNLPQQVGQVRQQQQQAGGQSQQQDVQQSGGQSQQQGGQSQQQQQSNGGN